MIKIVAYISSRNRKSNTFKYANQIIQKLEHYDNVQATVYTPNNLQIKPCQGCQSCFSKGFCWQKDDLDKLLKKISEADIFIIGSPVYLHSMNSDCKALFDRMAYQSHFLSLQGKRTVVISTCSSNGHNTVINEISKIIQILGGSVITKSNAAWAIPNQLNNLEWLENKTDDIAKDIFESLNGSFKISQFTQNIFETYRNKMKHFISLDLSNHEVEFWKNTGMINYDSFQEYCNSKSSMINRIENS